MVKCPFQSSETNDPGGRRRALATLSRSGQVATTTHPSVDADAQGCDCVEPSRHVVGTIA
jgi:hypothetical protein